MKKKTPPKAGRPKKAKKIQTMEEVIQQHLDAAVAESEAEWNIQKDEPEFAEKPREKKKLAPTLDLYERYALACSILAPAKRKASSDEDRQRHIAHVVEFGPSGSDLDKLIDDVARDN